jgi:hypothetical protein
LIGTVSGGILLLFFETLSSASARNVVCLELLEKVKDLVVRQEAALGLMTECESG